MHSRNTLSSNITSQPVDHHSQTICELLYSGSGMKLNCFSELTFDHFFITVSLQNPSYLERFSLHILIYRLSLREHTPSWCASVWT